MTTDTMREEYESPGVTALHFRFPRVRAHWLGEREPIFHPTEPSGYQGIWHGYETLGEELIVIVVTERGRHFAATFREDEAKSPRFLMKAFDLQVSTWRNKGHPYA
ncbi:MAG: hypothetical protein V3W44_08480 [Dehalococcoidales bacterium]